MSEEENEVELRCTIELMARPKEAAIDSLKKILATAEENGKKLRIYNEVYSEPKELEKDFYSVYVTFNVSSDIESLFNFILDYAPSTIEVIKPEKVDLPISSLQTLLNDISGRLNEMDQTIKVYSASNVLLQNENSELKKKLNITDENKK
ncbi:hypothetical protein IHI26_01685 [Candidatus Parvarchaeota archaeon]|jgi:hypothetical protein|nr:hypothetical protein [Candidatus Acidifodinimicrobium mancum]MBE5730024.1 hypothetical protein [Candidatus Acidifodinimicrobium mancum]